MVTIAGVSGTVEDFSMRRTTLRDLNGVVHTVPNGEIRVASNQTRVWARINQDVTVAYGTDIEKATRVVNDVGQALVATRPGDGGSSRRPTSSGSRRWPSTASPQGAGRRRAPEQWAAGGELLKRLLAAFATHGIEIPGPSASCSPGSRRRTSSPAWCPTGRPRTTCWRARTDGGPEGGSRHGRTAPRA